MRRLTIPCLLALSLVLITALGRAQAPAAGRATVYEGARLIVGTASAPIENAAFVVDGGKFTQIGRAGQVQVPAGAARVDLRGKTVIPAIVDTHTHMPVNREELMTALQRKAYYGGRRRDEPRPGHGRRRDSGAERDAAQRRAASHCRPRSHDA